MRKPTENGPWGRAGCRNCKKNPATKINCKNGHGDNIETGDPVCQECSCAACRLIVDELFDALERKLL
jgi:hypothetical protein